MPPGWSWPLREPAGSKASVTRPCFSSCRSAEATIAEEGLHDCDDYSVRAVRVVARGSPRKALRMYEVSSLGLGNTRERSPPRQGRAAKASCQAGARGDSGPEIQGPRFTGTLPGMVKAHPFSAPRPTKIKHNPALPLPPPSPANKPPSPGVPTSQRGLSAVSSPPRHDVSQNKLSFFTS